MYDGEYPIDVIGAENNNRLGFGQLSSGLFGHFSALSRHQPEALKLTCRLPIHSPLN